MSQANPNYTYLKEKAKIEESQKKLLMRLPEKEQLIDYIRYVESIFLVKKENDRVSKEDLEKGILGGRLNEKNFEDFFHEKLFNHIIKQLSNALLNGNNYNNPNAKQLTN
jgi:hypothetical protein